MVVSCLEHCYDYCIKSTTPLVIEGALSVARLQKAIWMHWTARAGRSDLL